MVELITHTAVILPQTQSPGEAGVMGNPSLGVASPSFSVYACPLSSTETYQTYGVELKGAYAVMAELAYRAYFQPNAVVQLTPLSGQPTFELICTASALVFDAEDDADHLDQLCYDPQFQP